jgi:hypothetical protein
LNRLEREEKVISYVQHHTKINRHSDTYIDQSAQKASNRIQRFNTVADMSIEMAKIIAEAGINQGNLSSSS